MESDAISRGINKIFLMRTFKYDEKGNIFIRISVVKAAEKKVSTTRGLISTTSLRVQSKENNYAVTYDCKISDNWKILIADHAYLQKQDVVIIHSFFLRSQLPEKIMILGEDKVFKQIEIEADLDKGFSIEWKTFDDGPTTISVNGKTPMAWIPFLEKKGLLMPKKG